MSISIHAPAKGATVKPTEVNFFGIFQSTLPRRERPIPVWVCLGFRVISIHAPAKGATAFQLDAPFMLSISIHAPAKGATTEYFDLDRFDAISIHAPAKGATS